MEILLDEPVSTKAETLALGIQTGDIIAMDLEQSLPKAVTLKAVFLMISFLLLFFLESQKL